MDVSIIIVNYNTCALTLQCIDSIYKHTKGLTFEIIVVDNASNDNSVVSLRKHFKNVEIIENKQNLGFGRANNIGTKYAKGKYYLFLNSDTILIDNVILQFYKYLEENEHIASCGTNLVDINGKPLVCHGNFPTLFCEFSNIGFFKLYKKYYINKLSTAQNINEGNINNVDYICGADIFIRKNVFEKLYGFDENFFMYYEETDLYFRLKKKGYISCILPNAKIIHLEGGSQTNDKKRNINKFKMTFKSKCYYFSKNYSKYKLYFVKLFAFISIFTHYNLYKGHIKEMISIIKQS